MDYDERMFCGEVPMMYRSGFPGCCSAGVLSGMSPSPREDVKKDLAKFEAEGKRGQLGALFLTVSTNQERQFGWAGILKEAGWENVFTFVSNDYGGGEIFVWAKRVRTVEEVFPNGLPKAPETLKPLPPAPLEVAAHYENVDKAADIVGVVRPRRAAYSRLKRDF